MDGQRLQRGIAGQRAQVRERQQPLHCQSRQRGHAKAALYQLDHGRDGRDGVHAARLHLRLAQRVEQRHVRLRAALKGQDVGPRKVFERVAALAVRLAVAHKHHLHGRDGLAANAVCGGGQRGKHGVQRAPADLLQQHGGGLHRQLQLQQRVVFAQLLHPRDEP